MPKKTLASQRLKPAQKIFKTPSSPSRAGKINVRWNRPEAAALHLRRLASKMIVVPESDSICNEIAEVVHEIGHSNASAIQYALWFSALMLMKKELYQQARRIILLLKKKQLSDDLRMRVCAFPEIYLGLNPNGRWRLRNIASLKKLY